MNVYIVAKFDVENYSIKGIHKTLEGAEKRLFEERDKLVERYKDEIKFYLTSDLMFPYKEELEKTIKMFSDNNYKNWDNGYHDNLEIKEWEVDE